MACIFFHNPAEMNFLGLTDLCVSCNKCHCNRPELAIFSPEFSLLKVQYFGNSFHSPIFGTARFVYIESVYFQS